MAHLAYAQVSQFQRKKTEKIAKASRKTSFARNTGLARTKLCKVVGAAVADAKAVRAMHNAIIERAATSLDVSNMTHFDASMTEFEVIAKFMGISVEEAATL